MEFPPTRKSEAMKAAGEAAQTTLKSMVKEAIKETLQETDYMETSDSSSGTGRSLLLFAAGVAVGYALAKQSPSWLSSAEESISEKSGGQIDRIAETVTGSGGSERESESGYDASEMNEERVGSDTGGGPDIGSGTDGGRTDIESATDEGTADIGSNAGEGTHVDSDADEYGTEGTNVGPDGSEYGASEVEQGVFDADESGDEDGGSEEDRGALDADEGGDEDADETNE